MSNNSLTNELFKPGNSVQIEFRDQLKNRKVYKTIIIKVSQDTLTVLLPETTEETNIQAGTNLVVISSNSEEQLYFTSETIEIIEGTPSLLVINKPKKVKTYSRRNFFRCDVDLTLIYWDDPEKQRVGKVTNLSASGLYAIIPYERLLKNAMIIHCQIHLPNLPVPLSFDAKIIRIEKTEFETKRGVALSFENINEKFQNHIIKYLFQRQRELIKLGHIRVGRV